MTSAQVHERNALTVKGRKINWFECNRPLPSSKNPHFQNEARRTTFLMKMSIIWMRMKNDFHIKGWRLSFPRKKLEFKSSEMTKNVSIIHKVEHSFIYFVHYSLWKSYSYWPCSFSESDCLLKLWKVQIVWLKKKLYMDIFALGFDHFMTFF